MDLVVLTVLFLILWSHSDFLGCDLDHSANHLLAKGCKHLFLSLSPEIFHKMNVWVGILSQESQSFVTLQGFIINNCHSYYNRNCKGGGSAPGRCSLHMGAIPAAQKCVLGVGGKGDRYLPASWIYPDSTATTLLLLNLMPRAYYISTTSG